jgi:hypothetical protein
MINLKTMLLRVHDPALSRIMGDPHGGHATGDSN